MNEVWSPERALEEMRSLYGAERSEGCRALADRLWCGHADEPDPYLGEW